MHDAQWRVMGGAWWVSIECRSEQGVFAAGLVGLCAVRRGFVGAVHGGLRRPERVSVVRLVLER